MIHWTSKILSVFGLGAAVISALAGVRCLRSIRRYGAKTRVPTVPFPFNDMRFLFWSNVGLVLFNLYLAMWNWRR